MFRRAIQPRLPQELDGSAVVALLGPRQSGKTTLAVGRLRPRLYLNLESTSDRARLDEPEAFLSAHQDDLVIRRENGP
jgi:predicted AAA+ superfamily ATPase